MGNITETSVFENINQFDTSLNETIYNSSYMIGVSEVGPNVREISLLALLDEGGALTNNDGTPFPQSEIDGINNLAIVWYYKDDEIHIHQIYNHDTGEVYWDYESIGNMDWTDNDDKLVGSILMYGNLESVIGVN